MKLLIAINEDKGFNSKLSEHFGHCPYFAIYKTETKDGVTGYVADGYSITSRKYKNLLNNNVELHIITGASENILSNEAIVSLFNENKIYVKRKSEWFNKKTDFMDNYESYILEACQI